HRTCAGALVAILLFTLVTGAARATDIQLSDGRVLHGATIVSIGEKDATILQSTGTVSVPKETVPSEILARAKARLDEAEQIRSAATARDARQREIASAKEQEKRMNETALEAYLKVMQVLPDGILASPTADARRGIPKMVAVKVPVWTATGEAPPSDPLTRRGLGGPPPMVSQKLDGRDPVTFNELVFVACKSDGLCDGSVVTRRVWPAGTFSYKNVSGSVST